MSANLGASFDRHQHEAGRAHQHRDQLADRVVGQVRTVIEVGAAQHKVLRRDEGTLRCDLVHGRRAGFTARGSRNCTHCD